MYGTGGTGKPIKANYAKTPLTIEPGQKVPPAGLTEWLTRVPYPEKGDNTQRAVNDRKSDGLSVLRIEFGVFCRDGYFSPEYAKSMRHAKFAFDTKWKNFRLSLLMEATGTGQSPSTRLIVFKSSAIRLVLSSVQEDEFSCTLIMHHPPSFEQVQARVLAEEALDQEQDDNISIEGDAPRPPKPRTYIGRQRRPAFDSEHQAVSAFTSRVARFVFETENLRNDFEDLLQAIGCPAAKVVEMEHQSRALYSTSKRHKVHSWLNKLESRSVAFQLARLYQNGLLIPEEVTDLRPVVEKLLTKKSAFVCADVLHSFVEELVKMEDRWYDRILKDTSWGERDLAQNVDIMEVLQGFVEKNSNKVDWKEHHKSHIMQCLHVILTPTSMILEGPYPDQSNRPLR